MLGSTQPDTENSRKFLRLPDFLIIGAARSATTTLYHYLGRHPGIFMSTSKRPGLFLSKEPQFFSRESQYAKGLDWYGSLFEESDYSQVCGEASTPYTHYPLTKNVPLRISRVLPQVKLIYIMRHPVDRAYSHYKMHMQTGGVQMTFDQALRYGDPIWEGWDARVYLESSNYIKQIRHYLRYLPKSSFLFLLYENFIEEPRWALNECQRFLGVPERDLTAEGLIVSNHNSTDYSIRHRTTYRLRKVPGLGRVADALPQRFRDRVHSLVRSSALGRHYSRTSESPPIPLQTRARLLSFFREPNRELEDFLGRDLSCWDQ